MKKRRRKKLHPTGQLSIFAILMFQMLFILFAMSLNVALVVHDKINLQNSVDLAAYYGAMKQAEMMNAIAHINYQIRQSWKLFVWRYRVLGNIGVAQSNRVRMGAGGARDLLPLRGPPSPGREGPYFFCVGHRFWDNLSKRKACPRLGTHSNTGFTDNLCLDMDYVVSPLNVPIVSHLITGNLTRYLSLSSRQIDLANQEVGCKCELYGYNSWLLGTHSVIYFRRDQSARKYMIKKLAETIRDGNDLDGGSIKTGMENTFRKNLSFINAQNATIDPFNSLKGIPVKNWLQDSAMIRTNVLYAALKSMSGGTGCIKDIQFLLQDPFPVYAQPSKQHYMGEMAYDTSLWPDRCNTPYKCNPSAGIYKNSNFIVFYAVKAEVTYKNQIFLPGGRNLKLKARALAKPFGGRIGPPPNADRLLNDTGGWQGHILKLPNYSRYPGDKVGLRSDSTQSHWSFIRDLSGNIKSLDHYWKKKFPNDPDPLKRMESGAGGLGRKWEMKAIAPDLFDITYFTILPYYQHTYFKKVKKLVGNEARGDLGYVGADVGYGFSF